MSQFSRHRVIIIFTYIMLAFTMMCRPLFAQNQSMFEGFWVYCVEQAIEETNVSRKNLYEFSRDEIVQLARTLGWFDIPEAVWATYDGSWIITDMKIDEPQNCSAVSFNDPVNHNLVEWNAQIADDNKFGSRGIAVEQAGRSSGWATTPVDGGFVQISLHNNLFSTNPFVSLSTLTAIRVGLTPASCELFPSKCN